MIKVGIPRALLYYQYLPMWRTFFTALGAEVVVSPSTNRAIMSSGAARVVADTCLPVKVFCGHVLELADKCDYVFIPAIASLHRRTHNCSKFLGLPDIARAVVPEARLLEVDINLPQGKRDLYQSIYSLGRRFTWNMLKVKGAAEAAWQAHLDYQRMMADEGLTPPQVLEGEVTPAQKGEGWATIAVIGHPYVIYDDFINLRILGRIREMGVRVVTPEMVPQAQLAAGVVRLLGHSYWTYEDEVTGAGGYYLETGVDGIISVTPFGCGPDSLMQDVVRRHARDPYHKPFMSLVIDEHTAEAGLITRLEAFLDMIQRRRQFGARV
ncbi:MAG: hypothetical protein HYX99_03360 [Chloroflexi bacterium]|nr:hypothetical protein [Chloroflexota bacterium]